MSSDYCYRQTKLRPTQTKQRLRSVRPLAMPDLVRTAIHQPVSRVGSFAFAYIKPSKCNLASNYTRAGDLTPLVRWVAGEAEGWRRAWKVLVPPPTRIWHYLCLQYLGGRDEQGQGERWIKRRRRRGCSAGGGARPISRQLFFTISSATRSERVLVESANQIHECRTQNPDNLNFVLPVLLCSGAALSLLFSFFIAFSSPVLYFFGVDRLIRPSRRQIDLTKVYPSVLSAELLAKVSTFLLYAPRFKNDILLAQESNWPSEIAPWILPESVTILLSHLCGISNENVEDLWSYLKDTVWIHDEKAREVETRLKLYGKALGYVSVYPPFAYCPSSNCDRKMKGLKLQKVDQTEVVLYTLDKGVCPAWAIRLQCEGPHLPSQWLDVTATAQLHRRCSSNASTVETRDETRWSCGTTYYHNYQVKDGMRYYYDEEIPDIIQVGEHQFVEKRVLKMWCTDTNIAWKSFTNCARTYQMSLSKQGTLPSNWPIQDALKGDHVQDGFTILSLLEDHRERQAILTVPHTGEQADRFTEAIRERNHRIKLCGLQEILHRCKKCTRICEVEGQANVSVWVAVMDGIGLQHPTCAHHNCKTPLTTSRDRYCVEHRDLNNICAIKGCNARILEGKRTCSEPDHQEVERVYVLRGESRVQLQEKLKRQRVSHPNDALPDKDLDVADLIDDEEEEEFEINEEDLIHGVHEGVSDPRGASPVRTSGSANKKRISARFGRKRTHNEQILVAPCGVILARETFYGAEAISMCARSHSLSLQEFIKRTFRINGQAPNHIFFDNNCSLAKHVKDDPFFAKKIGLTVDVFHFNCKHSERDVFCQSNCNPAAFKELHGENGKAWFFNSSIAEQTNVWLGGFHAIVREMLVDRFNFFLDQMILLRNQMTLEKLKKDGHCPVIKKLE
ncbi:hypothetical protein GALMADRAFT_283614 [Galerina marginata CBS 339.88]|uniref:CxC6 like cysteine cluster associated with KDZ domain-containing protein n=1 Tax=Galerina marginata (strain CBS 339.88) TaxID=685588 RepID=A0A067SHQ9_GALM3|nr:hypothetical protein GALMADRAFT_283614 [Galerina marginata CBS 339.88]